ncbi:unnamed protein product, partial [Mycena citricolor]
SRPGHGGLLSIRKINAQPDDSQKARPLLKNLIWDGVLGHCEPLLLDKSDTSILNNRPMKRRWRLKFAAALPLFWSKV